MSRPDNGLLLVVLVATLTLAGCEGLFTTRAESNETLTPAPIPEQSTEEPTLTGDPASWDGWDDRSVRNDPVPVVQPRYLTLRPNCKRPPGLVVHIQVSALSNNHPSTDGGINTTWQFAAPSNRRTVGSYEAFVDVIKTQYRPVLMASTVTYGPLRRSGDTATQEVRVEHGNQTTSYEWRLKRQTRPPYVGCWMTTAVVPDQARAPA